MNMDLSNVDLLLFQKILGLDCPSLFLPSVQEKITEKHIRNNEFLAQ